MVSLFAAAGIGAVLAIPGQVGPTHASAACTFPTCVPPSSLGVGAVQAFVTFTAGHELPKFGQSGCANVQFTFSATLYGAAFNTVGSQFPGAAPITGSGSNLCATLDDELGGTNFNVAAFNDTFNIPDVGSATLACSTGLAGNYQRVGTHMVILLGGSCNINQTFTGPVTFLSTGDFVPGIPQQVPAPANPVLATGGGDGMNAPISNGVYYGSWSFLIPTSN
jgi:hypothetical protein